MEELSGKSVLLRDAGMLERQRENYDYLMSLKNDHLLRNYELEAGRFTNRKIDTDTMGGWEASTCQLRGHFLGHWLSAAAYYIEETGDCEIQAKADNIVSELARCQQDNGGQWAASIPEKYLYWIGEGRKIWAPQYTVHKLLMGLVDMYCHAGNQQALMIADHMADWFYTWSGEYTREQFDDILDYETGGMLEVWADLLAITQADKYRVLLDRYYRRRLFDPLLEGQDVLTNMHANTTIPEILGCARAYEVTGEQKYFDIVKAYWRCAVTERGTYVTGGQTEGEVWTPKMKLKNRIGNMNQEFCTVYNMMRLADFLFLYTKDPGYLQYREYNLHNGVMAQSYYASIQTESHEEKKGLLTYFLPMKAGSRKQWAGRMDSFFCCHGTMIQANARLNQGIFYRDRDEIYVGQYVESELILQELSEREDNASGQNTCGRLQACYKKMSAENCGAGSKCSGEIRILLQEDTMNGLTQISSENNAAQTVNQVASAYDSKPDFRKYILTVRLVGMEKRHFSLNLRMPEWITRAAEVYKNGKLICKTEDTSKFLRIDEEWKDGDAVTVILPVGIKFIPLPDDPNTGAFRYGPDVLVGITEQERILELANSEGEDPCKELAADRERQWGQWNTYYRTENQNPGIDFRCIDEIGDEPYQVYFKIRRR